VCEPDPAARTNPAGVPSGLAVHGAQQPVHIAHVQAGGRLVEDVHTAGFRQAPGQFQPLALAAGQRGVAQEPAADAPDRLRVGELARLLGVRTSALRVWEAAGLLTPGRESETGYRVYSAQDVRDARIIQTLRESYYLFDRIRPIIDGLRRTGSSEALQEALADRGLSLGRRSAALLEGSALLWSYVTSIRDAAQQV
jgi:DNA-binding transcriptional MerR regulator